ncbi:MAG: phosphoribosylaminoimidazolesuccinocarboxamide synthase [Deltaproteobacteria bacterium]|nr:phosphoribosylaminoimidazolesuccinocarboxamide synthase [Deltaproteobacteria bacterium]
MPETPVVTTNFDGLKLVCRGKVRDIYDLDDHLLIIASDRISAFDVVMAQAIPGKGRVLTQISKFWFDLTSGLTKNHLVSTNPRDYPAVCQPYADVLADRSMLVIKAEPLAIECIVRGYLSGSGWKEYQKNGQVCGIPLPVGLLESDQLPEPIFTPSTKAQEGQHDENITSRQAADLIGTELFTQVSRVSLTLYRKAAELALQKGIIIADTKFEFGLRNGELILIDEVLTPDSSRFWPKDQYRPGGPQPSFDKQFLRDYLESLHWGKTPPAPELPLEIIEKTAEKYQEALRRLTI